MFWDESGLKSVSIGNGMRVVIFELEGEIVAFPIRDLDYQAVIGGQSGWPMVGTGEDWLSELRFWGAPSGATELFERTNKFEHVLIQQLLSEHYENQYLNYRVLPNLGENITRNVVISLVAVNVAPIMIAGFFTPVFLYTSAGLLGSAGVSAIPLYTLGAMTDEVDEVNEVYWEIAKVDAGILFGTAVGEGIPVAFSGSGRLPKFEVDYSPRFERAIAELDMGRFGYGYGRNPSVNLGATGHTSSVIEVPSVRNGEFNRWMDQLSPDEFLEIWSNPALRERIEDRLRHPGGLHEWHMVARTDVFKKWGLSVEQIKTMRSLISEVEFVNPLGRHGGRGSTTAHNEILDIIDTSLDYDTFVRRLQIWSNYRLRGGADALPPGLSP